MGQPQVLRTHCREGCSAQIAAGHHTDAPLGSSDPPPSVQPDEPCELVVVGAGLAALHLVARLPPALAQVCAGLRRAAAAAAN